METPAYLKQNLIADVENICCIKLDVMTKIALSRCFEITLGHHFRQSRVKCGSYSLNEKGDCKQCKGIEPELNTKQMDNRDHEALNKDAQAGVKPLSMPPFPDGLDDEDTNHYYFKRGWIGCWRAIESKLKGQVKADCGDTDGQI